MDKTPGKPRIQRPTEAEPANARSDRKVSGHPSIQAWIGWAHHLGQAPERQIELAREAQASALRLMRYAATARSDTAPPFTPKAHDRRFDHPAWRAPPFNMVSQGFLAVQDWWDKATDRQGGLSPDDAARTRFIARQVLDLLSPANLPWLNPEIIAETKRTGGRNLQTGAAVFTDDLRKTISQSPSAAPEGFRVGEDLACTPGQVVFRNDLFELIQYAPQTGKVQGEPILIVPAWIMKYYVLDLSPQNSMVKYLVGQGFTVFMMSWCNPTAAQADLSLEDYRTGGVMAALAEIDAIVPNRKVHAVGYCLGGTILAIAAATMARDKDSRLASVTLLATQVDFAEKGELLLFLDETQVAFFEGMMQNRGYLDRPQMTQAFTPIRRGDLILSRAIRRYFLGKADVAGDMAVWLADLTRMPARMHSQYLRELFLENRLSTGRFVVGDRAITLTDISAPLFVIAAEADHIAPWKSVFRTQMFTDCDLTFVLTSGGHNSGIVNEPGNTHRHFRLSHRAPGANCVAPEAWLAGQEITPGSWWPAWKTWLDDKSTGRVSADTVGGAVSLGSAPGTYVHQT